MKVIVEELNEPTLIGNVTFQAPLLVYRKIQALKSLSLNPIVITGQIGHILVMELLIKHEWVVLPHRLGKGTHPSIKDDPVMFLEKKMGKTLNIKTRKFLSSKILGIPGLALECDMLVAKKDAFVMIEIKSSKKDIKSFAISFNQYIYYRKAVNLGIPVKLVLVEILDDIYISISSFFGELNDKSLLRVTVYKGGSKYEILKVIWKYGYINQAKIAKEITRMPNPVIGAHLVELESAGLVEKEGDKWHCTQKGSMLM